MAGRVTEKVERKRVNGRIVEKVKEETTGGILHWGRENDPDLEWFRKEIAKPTWPCAKVLDPFAGGGAIPLEAMRLGCDVTAMDINPVAWFILKCTLEYPQKLTGQTRPLPEFALADRSSLRRSEGEGLQRGQAANVPRTSRPRQGRGDPTRRTFRVRFASRSGLGLARAGLGSLGAGPRPPGVGFLLSHLCRVSARDSNRRR